MGGGFDLAHRGTGARVRGVPAGRDTAGRLLGRSSSRTRTGARPGAGAGGRTRTRTRPGGRSHGRYGGEHPVLGSGQLGVGGALGHGLPDGPLGGGQVADGTRGECAPGLDDAGETPKRFGGARAGRGDQRVLAGEEFRGAGEFEQDARFGAEFGLLASGEGAVDGEGGIDDAGVRLVRRVRGCASVRDVLAGGAETLRCGHEGPDADHDVGAELAGLCDGVPVAEPQPADGGVGAPRLLFQGGAVVGGGVGQVADGGAPFGLELGDGGRDGGAYLLVDVLDPGEPGYVLGGADGSEAPEGEQGHDGHHQERHDLRPDGGGTQARARPGRTGPSVGGVRRAGSGALPVLRCRRFLGGRSGVGPAAACRGHGQLWRRCLRWSAGCAHGLLVPGAVQRAGRGRSAGRSGRRRRLGVSGPERAAPPAPARARPGAERRMRRRRVRRRSGRGRRTRR